MESSLSSVYATSLPKSPSMITTKRTTSTSFLQVKNCSHKKTRNGNLINKLQKSLNNFIKHHKTTITLSGSKRFSDKSGDYYLKNSNHKCNLNNNYLTPIPSIKKLNSHYEKNSLNKAERTAVYLRRMEYSSCIKNNKRIDKINKIKTRKIVFIQQWWKMMFKIILIQKNVRGFLSRKLLIETLDTQGKFINDLFILKSSVEKIILRHFFSKLEHINKNLSAECKILRKRILKIQKKSKEKVFVFWKILISNTKNKCEKFIILLQKKITRGFFEKLRNNNKKKVYHPISTRRSRRQFSCELIQTNTAVLSHNSSSIFTKVNESTENAKKRNASAEKKKIIFNNSNITYTTNISLNTSIDLGIKVEKTVVSKKSTRARKKNKTTVVYSNQISSTLSKKIQGLQLVPIKPCEKLAKTSFQNIENQINLNFKQFIKNTKYRKCVIKKFFKIWKQNSKGIQKQNSTINIKYCSRKNSPNKKIFKKPKIVKKYICIGTSLLYNAFINWKKNNFPKPLLNLTIFSLLSSFSKKLREQKESLQINQLQFSFTIITNVIMRNKFNKWLNNKYHTKRPKKRTVFAKTKSAIELPSVPNMLTNESLINNQKTLELNSFHISQSTTSLTSVNNTITAGEDKQTFVYSKKKNNWQKTNKVLFYTRKKINTNFNYKNYNAINNLDSDFEDKCTDNYLNNTLTMDWKYNVTNTNTTSTNITGNDNNNLSGIGLKEVPTIKTKVIHFKKKTV